MADTLSPEAQAQITAAMAEEAAPVAIKPAVTYVKIQFGSDTIRALPLTKGQVTALETLKQSEPERALNRLAIVLKSRTGEEAYEKMQDSIAAGEGDPEGMTGFLKKLLAASAPFLGSDAA